jgi:nitric oxide dioxygenase
MSRRSRLEAQDVTVRTFYNSPESADVQGRDYDEVGFITADWLAQNTPMRQATYYLCGPRPFLRALVGSLARTGVALGRIRYEFFGPADELLAA